MVPEPRCQRGVATGVWPRVRVSFGALIWTSSWLVRRDHEVESQLERHGRVAIVLDERCGVAIAMVDGFVVDTE
jgi:hypothetical protein